MAHRSMRWGVLLLLSACGTFGGPKSGLKLETTDREKITRQLTSRDFVLASSLYVTADFFGDSSRQFADARPFEIIQLWRHNGEDAAVAVATGEIVQAGTPVRLKEIDFPVDPLTAPFAARAKLELAPTAHTWLVVERTDKPGSSPLVLVLPREIDGAEQFNAAVQKRLASPQWMTSWLAQTPPEHAGHVFRKEVVAGMSRAAMLAALGEPKNAAEQESQGTLEFVADYGDLQITVQGNVVAKVVSLKQEAAEARAKAEEAAAKAQAAEEARRVEQEKERAVQAEAEKKRIAEAEAARAVADAKAKAAREAEDARRAAEAKRLAAEEEERQKQAALAARLEAARVAKEDAEKERLRRIEQAKAEAQVAKAEKEALEAKKKAEADAVKAEAEARAAREKLEREVKVAEEAAVKARQKLDDSAAKDARVADNRKPVAAPAPAVAPAAAEPAAPPPPPRKIGVKLQALTKELAFDLGLRSLDGAVVLGVTPGGAAERAGLAANDVVLAIDGKQVRTPEELTGTISTTAYEKSIVLSVWRGGKRTEIKIAPQSTTPAATSGAKASAPAPARAPATTPAATSSPRPVLMPQKRTSGAAAEGDAAGPSAFKTVVVDE